MQLQALVHAVAGSGACGCKLGCMRLQAFLPPADPTIAQSQLEAVVETVGHRACTARGLQAARAYDVLIRYLPTAIVEKQL